MKKETKGSSLLMPVALVLVLTIEKAQCQLGMAFSPFVRNRDNPGTSYYTQRHVEAMLKLIADQKFNLVTTYGVGAPAGESYLEDVTWKRCASIVHTAQAAAEINRSQNKLALAVYQGLYMDSSTNDQLLRTETDVGFEVASRANKIYNGSVAGLVFPSVVQLNDFTSSSRYLTWLTNAMDRTRQMNLKLGTRITDCSTVESVNTRSNNVERIFQLLDFVICQILPGPNHFQVGPGIFSQDVIGSFQDEERIFKAINPKLEVMLETGWPGGENLGHPNTEMSNMLEFWGLMEDWARKPSVENLQRKIFFHEAFDNPWKRQIPTPLGPNYGRWRHLQNTSDISKNAFELKTPPPLPSSTEVPPTQSTKTEAPKGRRGASTELVIGIVFGLVLFCGLVGVIFIAYRRMASRLNRNNKLSEEDIRQFLDGIIVNQPGNEEKVPGENAWRGAPYNKDFELERNKFSIDHSSPLGSGAFGSVYTGKIDGLISNVAFKMTRADCPVSTLKNLLSEIKILAYLGKHENIVSICGAYTAELKTAGIVYVATELCSNGSMETFLRQNKPNIAPNSTVRYVNSIQGLNPTVITDVQLFRWCLQIASAMEYIGSKNVIHADLATRNVLLTTDLTAKVTDFGLSRHLYEYTEYVKKQQEPLPWRWMAVESLKHLEFSTKSDVWSFGVTLWEIFSLGDIPYPGLSWNIDFVSQLETGLRMSRPVRASITIYEIMLSCWDTVSTQRPTFPALKEALLALQSSVIATNDSSLTYNNVNNIGT